MIVTGTMRMGRMTEPRANFTQVSDVDLRLLLLQDHLPSDTVIEAGDGAMFTVLDVDVHHWPVPPAVEELAAHLAAVSPSPDASWVSHGRGLKLVYTGRSHRERALAAAFKIPGSFHLELLKHTRHPRSASSAHTGASCGPVSFCINNLDAPFEFRTAGRLTSELRTKALQILKMEANGRYSHDRCPIAPDSGSTAQGCVLVLDAGVFCHRCAAHGVRHADRLKAGFFPFAAIVGNELTDLELLSRGRVHWTHARLELIHRYPHLGETLLREAYTNVLESMWGANDPRIPLIFNRDLDFVFGDGLWLDARMLQPTQLDNDAASGLPYILEIGTAKGEAFVFPDKVRRAQAKFRMPCGYTPVRPIRGISFADDSDFIPMPVPPPPVHPICLLTDPIPEDEAFLVLGRYFPRLDRVYFTAALAAAICADAAGGQPPMLTCSGPSGSGKEQHVRLAASFMGQDVVKLTLSDGEEVFMRQVGVAVTSGNRFLMFDELGKTRDLISKMKMLYTISSTVTWRPLFENRQVNTPVRTAFFFPCVRFPDFLKGSQEFLRRTRHVFLHRRIPNWMQTSGGDTAAWRDRTPENARVANSILTRIWSLTREHRFRFF